MVISSEVMVNKVCQAPVNSLIGTTKAALATVLKQIFGNQLGTQLGVKIVSNSVKGVILLNFWKPTSLKREVIQGLFINL